MKRHVMLDLETLGLKPGCPIISIGAICFLNEPLSIDNKFYIVISPESQYGIMDSADQGTLNWWAKQSEESRAEVFNNPDAQDIIVALHKFKHFLKNLQVNEEDEIVIWGKGASFDEPILAEAFKRAVIPVQWSYRNSMCQRTLEALGEMIGITMLPFEGIKHNAFADAWHQARVARRIINTLVTLKESEE